ncbi:MAG: AAA family ATPase [Nanoarchaeota archaeon]|nr:AAA family ATPase [Nanoarchaeota archaeon]
MTPAMWTEKYRPENFSDVYGQNEIVKRIEAFVQQKNMPHLLFSGPAGVGKTSLALVIAKQLFQGSWHQNFLELNASDERGIDIVRNKVKDFARTKAIGDVPFKIIYLDESDALTKEAQQALRRTMENYTKTCRFVLACVTPDTKILLPQEREIMIEKFIDQYEHKTGQIHIQNISKNRDSTKKDLVLAAVKLPPRLIGKKVLEITTMTGKKIKVTDDHQLLTIDGWKEAGKITKEDNLLIHPHLEGTPVEDNSNKIIDLDKFIKFLSTTEEQDGLETIETASRFRRLKSTEKEKIIQKIEELRKIIKEDKGLTEREFELYNLIKQNHQITRKKLQEKLCLTRMGTNYLLLSLVKKGYIKRIINKKTHSFLITNSEPITLRNDMDIRKIIEKEFNLKISYSAVRESIDSTIFRGRIDRVLGELKRKELLDITFNDIEKIGALTRICGFMLGDGHLVRNSIRLHFSGNREALKEVMKDLDILKHSNYSKIKSVTLKNIIRGREFVGTTTSFTLDSRPLSLLLQFFGIPKGDKTITPYTVPEFIKKGTKFVKREFLRALFGCDADKPHCKKMNFEAILLRQNKSIYLKISMINFYQELSNLFEEFEVETYIKIIDRKEIRKRDNIPVLTFGLVIKPNNHNLFKFFSQIGYAYETYKIRLAKLSAEYLRHKYHLINSWKEKSKLILTQTNSGKSIGVIAKEYDVTLDFVANQRKGKDVHLPRSKFIIFDEWIKNYKFNSTLFINEIDEIKEVDEELVMDITCQKDHNFITNGFVSHNCNYSSKIIDPIQSRCAVFHFKPLKEEDISKVIEKIAKEEGGEFQQSVLPHVKKALIEVSNGDCRKLTNIMQSCFAVKPKGESIAPEDIYSMVSAAKPKEIKEVLNLALNQQFIPSRNKLIDTMLQHGLSGLDIIKQIQREIWNLEIPDQLKVKLITHCGEIEFRMVEGSDEFVQLEAFLAFVLNSNSP